MTTLAIEINDAGLIVADQDRVIRSEPGFAVIDRGKIVTGDAAFALARLMPEGTSVTSPGSTASVTGGAAPAGDHRVRHDSRASAGARAVAPASDSSATTAATSGTRACTEGTVPSIGVRMAWPS